MRCTSPHLALSATIAALGTAAVAVAQPSWTEQKPTPAPVARQNHAMAYDANRKKTVLFGAWDGGQRRADTWEWDGTRWTLMKPTRSPTPRDAHAMAFDSGRNVIVMSGGYVNPWETWEYDGTTWTLRSPQTRHAMRAHLTMAYDSARRRTVAFGNGQTWEWDGNDWARKTTPSSPTGSAAAIAYDSLRRVCVLFVGTGTWEWNGTAWTRKAPPLSPTRRSAHAMVYDAGRQRVVLFGGGGSAQGDTWEYDGKTWTRVKTAPAPSAPRRFFAMAYDSDRRRTVLFGGRDFSQPNVRLVGDTWEYSAGPCNMIPDTAEVSIRGGGTQKLTLVGGAGNANRLYFIFGSASGTSPGVPVGGVTIPLNPDGYTNLAASAANTRIFAGFTGVLDRSGRASAAFNFPAGLPLLPGIELHHAFAVLRGNAFACASNAVLVTLR